MIEAEKLRETRQLILRMTQSELADHLGVSLRTVGNWERDGVPDSREHIVLRRIGKELEQSPTLGYGKGFLIPTNVDNSEIVEQLNLSFEDLIKKAKNDADLQRIKEIKNRKKVLSQFTFEELILEIQERYQVAIESAQSETEKDLSVVEATLEGPDEFALAADTSMEEPEQ